MIAKFFCGAMKKRAQVKTEKPSRESERGENRTTDLVTKGKAQRRKDLLVAKECNDSSIEPKMRRNNTHRQSQASRPASEQRVSLELLQASR